MPRDDEKIEVRFIDANGSVIDLEINQTYRNGYREFTASAWERGGGGGQMQDRIVPTNDAQKKLIELWNKYHLKEINDKVWGEILRAVKEVKRIEEEKKANSKLSWEDIDDPKIVALGKLLDISPDQANEIISGSGTQYNVGEGYYIVATDEEADNLAYEDVENLVDDIGLSSFNVNWDDVVQTDWFDMAMQESYDSYVEDIESESASSDEYENRLEEEIAEAGVETSEELSEHLQNQWRDGVEWYIDNFGEEDFNTVVKEKQLVDTEKLAEYIISVDGRGNLLNRYDGVEHEQEVNGTWYYLYEG